MPAVMDSNTQWTLSAFTDEAGGECQTQIEAAQRAGLSRIDLRGVDGHNISVLPLENAQNVKKQLDAAGISIQMFGSPIGKIDIADDLETDLQKLRHLGELAPVLGCSWVRIFSFYNKNGASHADWQSQSLDRLTQLRDHAQKLGLVLFHENERHIFGDLVADVQTLAQLRNAHFKTIFDFDNFNQSGENVWEAWQTLADVTDAIHLKDSTTGNMHVPVGQGNGQIPEILADALKRGWSGPLAIEPHLSHSGAVAATGPSGTVNQAYGKMPAPESFHLAASAATQMLNQIGARWK